MAKLYWTKDVKNIIDKKIAHDSAILITDETLTEEQVLHFRNDLLTFKKYAYEMIEEMEEADRQDEEEMKRLHELVNKKEDTNDE